LLIIQPIAGALATLSDQSAPIFRGNAMSRVAHLKFAADLAVRQYAPLLQELFYGPKVKAIFPEYLITLHSIIRASEPLLQLAANEAQRRCDLGDASCAGLAEYFLTHREEERDHAQWLLADIASLGIAPEQVLARQPSHEVAALVGSQYYWIMHYHPGFLLAYMVIFEAYPMEPAEVSRIQALTGLPDSAFRTMMLHTDLDVMHSADLFRFLETCALPDAIFDGLAASAIQTCAMVAKVLKRLAESVEP
jgi:hypothetical protein